MKSYGDFTVVLPTLNEQRTIGRVIESLLSEYRGVSVIVADDGSDDDTKKIVLDHSKRNKEVAFLDRHAQKLEKGLTASIVDGIRLSRTKYAIVMDADLQHPPAKIREIARQLEAGKELVVATRVDVTGWALYRQIISKTLMLLGKLVLLVKRRETCGDIFSGFFGVERKVFVEVWTRNRGRFVGEGYKILFDFLKCVKKGTLAIGEVPYVFEVRKQGKSKASIGKGIALFRSFFS